VTERDPDYERRYGSLFERRDEDDEEQPLWQYEREYEPIHPEPPWRALLKKLWAPIAAVGLLLWKFKFVLAAIFKFKIFTVAGSMLVSIGAYALLWGWRFAVGFVLLLLVHELGHAAEAKRQGLDVSAPFFIPFMGAVIAMRQMPHNVWREAQVAIAGPIVGSLGCAVAWGIGEALDSDLFRALAFFGFFLNLFNLIPFGSLDGGRIAAAIHPGVWIVGLALMLALLLIAPNPILILIFILVGLDAWHRWRTRNDPRSREYYSISRGKRVAVAAAYLGLVALLVLAMDATFIEKDFDDV
jgi:Zn-dependent protease